MDIKIRNETNDSEVILVYNGIRLKVNKQQLISKSLYFEMLLSSRFKDHLQNEHIINYDIPINILQIFIKWIHDDDVIITNVGDECKPSLQIFFKHKTPVNLLTLLQLSVLFLTEQLTEDLINILEAIWLKPKYLLHIWLMALDLNLTVLSNIFFAECLDRFNELLIDELVDLEDRYLIKLIANCNIRSSISYIWKILMKWIINKGKLYNLPLFKIKPHFLNCIELLDENCNIRLYCWDKIHFYEYSTFSYPTETTNNLQALTGMQFTGQRYNIYMCGGEYGIGTGKFNNIIWRYSLISKKWFVETLMPVARNRMITVFLNEKLFLVGGVGQNQTELNSVDIYNRYTKSWSVGETMPFSFSKIPEYCINNENLAIYMSYNIYIYYSGINKWRCPLLLTITKIPNMILLAGETDTCCIDIIDKKGPSKVYLRSLEQNDICCEEAMCLKSSDWSLVTRYAPTVNERLLLEAIQGVVLPNNRHLFILNNNQCLLSIDRYIVHLHSYPLLMKLQKSSSFDSDSRKFFHIMDPAHLYSYKFSNEFSQI